MQSFIYPATLTPDREEGGFVVTFIDLPEAITQGEDVEDALREAAGILIYDYLFLKSFPLL